jgi:arylsulfatase A-like enzyme/tetratricopeptide (TPR) repeat protein
MRSTSAGRASAPAERVALPAPGSARAGFSRSILLLGIPLLMALSAGCSGRSGSGQEPPIRPEETKPGRYGLWTEVSPGPTPLNLVVLTLDTTRSDHLSCYGFPGATTPNLDRIAAEGILFEEALTTAPVTLVAHSSIMTGLYPYQHGVRNNGTYVLDQRFQTLAEMLKARGYETGAILGAFPLDHRFGLDQGFDHYDDQFPAGSRKLESDTAQRPGSDVTSLALSWLDGVGTKPFFLWCHYFDPHAPYAPPKAYEQRFPRDPYSGEIAAMDAAIGDLVAGLTERGLLEKTVLMIVGDHGEGLGEHREMTHTFFVYNSTLKVPFLLRLPHAGAFEAGTWQGRRLKDPVSLVDCLPTALNSLGWSEADRPLCAGMSLLPVVEGKERGPSWIYFESLPPLLEYAISDLRGIVRDRWKYIRAPRPELYDLSQDPKELHDDAARSSPLRTRMEADLATVLSGDVGGTTGQVAMDQETIEKLRSLGYLAGGSPQRAAGPARDPKDMIDSFEQINRARTFVAEHRPADAVAVLDSVLAVRPDDGSALRIKAASLARIGRGGESVAIYDALLRDCAGCPDELELLLRRGMAYFAARQSAEAEKSARDLIHTNPRTAGPRLLLARVLAGRRDYAGARRAIEEEIGLFPSDPTPRIVLGDCEREAGDLKSAEAAYRAALDLNPNLADAMAGLAEILLTTGREASARGYIDQALTCDPNHPGALFRKGWFLRKDGRKDDAVLYYQKVLAQEPDNRAVLYNLGNIYMERGNLAGALELYNRAAQSGPPTQELLVNLGVVQAQMGNAPEAISQWEKALALDPGSAQAGSIRENIRRAKAGPGSTREIR